MSRTGSCYLAANSNNLLKLLVGLHMKNSAIAVNLEKSSFYRIKMYSIRTYEAGRI